MYPGPCGSVTSPVGDPLEPPRFVDDAFEQPPDRAVVERARGCTLRRARALPPRASAGRCRSPAVFFTRPTSSAQAARALSSRTSCSSSSSMRFRRDRRCGLQAALQPAHVLARARGARRRRPCSRDTFDERAADDGGVGRAAGFGDVLRASRCRSRPQSAAAMRRGPARAAPATSEASRVAHAGHAQPRDHVQKPASELRRPPDPRVGRRRADEEDRIEPGVDERLRGAAPASSTG